MERNAYISQLLAIGFACAFALHQHLRIVGYTTGSPFSDEALKRIFEYTRGIPRQINRLCLTALIAGRIDQKQILDESTIRKAIAGIDQA